MKDAALRKRQCAWHAQLREHVGALDSREAIARAFRHAFATALLRPSRPIETETTWEHRHYDHAARRLREHVESGCPGFAECPLYQEARYAVIQAAVQATEAKLPRRKEPVA